MKICLDTSAYSHFRRGDETVVDIIDRASWIGVPTVVLGELRAGFACGRRRRDNERALAAFLRHSVVRVLDVDDGASQLYGEIVAALRHAGTPLPANDIWIAAVAAFSGANVITFDAHFNAIARVGCTVLNRD